MSHGLGHPKNFPANPQNQKLLKFKSIFSSQLKAKESISLSNQNYPIVIKIFNIGKFHEI
jgi:hypothetical protein